MSDPSHTPVLLEETISLLAPARGETALDCTCGAGGHTTALAEAIGPEGTLVANDLDPASLAETRARLAALPAPPTVVELCGNFAAAPRLLADQGLTADVVLADLGFASGQMADPARGLSFSREGPLDMRLDPGGAVTASDLLKSLSEEELGEIIRDFGEERHWRRVARNLVEERQRAPITTTKRLAEVVRRAVGGRSGRDRIDPATRTFQALRIAVNDELGSLDGLLDAVRRGAGQAGSGRAGWLAPGARVAVISFHSLEDRRVKHAFSEMVSQGVASALARKPVGATEDEIYRNPRSRSARLRAVRISAADEPLVERAPIV